MSIMNPVLSGTNPLPDGEDLAAAQLLYGAPNASLNFTSQDIAQLEHLITRT